MGMFDYVHINLARLPVSAEDQERLRDENFQTKSVERVLSDLYITDDGYLERLMNKIVLDEESPGYKPPKRVRFSDVHGVLFFYTSADDSEWFEFMATFTNGRVFNKVCQVMIC